jgi:uncharacterized membrane protein YdbT with pleckstrin-like domain
MLRRLFFPKKSYEKVIFLLRRHWIIFIGTTLFYVLLGLIPLGFYFFFLYNYPEPLSQFLTNNKLFPIIIIAVSIYYLSIWLFYLTSFVNYYLDLWVVTNDRAMNIVQNGLFSRTVSELDLYKIQDATSEVKGFFPTIFNYGDVYVQTAGKVGRFVFEQVPNPNEVREKIIELMEDDRKYHQAS